MVAARKIVSRLVGRNHQQIAAMIAEYPTDTGHRILSNKLNAKYGIASVMKTMIITVAHGL
jgi:hypothetical protein